ncbi:MAG: hypothetical protein ACQGVC_07360 [Myxococcota bacterium]
MNRARVLLLAGVAVLLAAPVPPDALWRERGDREEGILRRKNTSGGASLLLEGVEIKPAQRPRAEDATLYLWIPEEGTEVLRVDVRERRSNYLMRPKPDRFRAGRPFVWPIGDVVRPARVNVARLRVKARDADDVYYPALLSSGEVRPPQRFAYEFVCMANGSFDVDWEIARVAGGRVERVQHGRREEDGAGPIRFSWDGLSEGGEVARAGVYRLAITGTDRSGDPIELFAYFRHYGAAD